MGWLGEPRLYGTLHGPGAVTLMPNKNGLLEYLITKGRSHSFFACPLISGYSGVLYAALFCGTASRREAA
jgi:hypothetical protein